MAKDLKKNSVVPGAEDVSTNDMSFSFIKLIQKSSTVKGTKPGDIVDSASGKKLGETVNVIPIKKFIDWIKFNDDFQVEDRSQDGITWKNSGDKLDEEEKWKNKRINFFVLLEDQEPDTLPYCLSFGKTSYKAGQKMQKISDQHIVLDKQPIFSQMFAVSSHEEPFGKYKSFVFDVELVGDIEDQAFLKSAMQLRESMQKKIQQNPERLLEAPQEQEEAAPPAKKAAAVPDKKGLKVKRAY